MLNLYINLGRVDIFTMLFPIHEHSSMSLLFRPLISFISILVSSIQGLHFLLHWHLSIFFSDRKWYCIFNSGFHMPISYIINLYVYFVSCQINKLDPPNPFEISSLIQVFSRNVFSFWVYLVIFLLLISSFIIL